METTETVETVEIAKTGPGIAIVVKANPGIVLTDEKTRESLFEYLEQSIEGYVPDLTTEKGRAAIATNAASISKMKVRIDAAGMGMNEDARKRVAEVNVVRKVVEARMEELRDRARAPLTEWERVEEARAQYVAATSDQLRQIPNLLATDDSKSAGAILAVVEAFTIDAEKAGERWLDLQALKTVALDSLRMSVARLERLEAEAAELATLRAEKTLRDAEAAAREKAEEDRKALEAAAERRRLAKEEREREEAARAKAEAERLALVQKAAEEEAARDKIILEERLTRLAAEREAKAKSDADAREAVLIEDGKRQARAAAEAATLAAKAESDRKDAEHAAEMKRLHDEQAARDAAAQKEADRIARDRTAECDRVAMIGAVETPHEEVVITIERRNEVIGAAEDALRAAGIAGIAAKKVVALIAAGRIPQVSISFESW